MLRIFKDLIAEPEPIDLVKEVCTLMWNAEILSEGEFAEYYRLFSKENRLPHPESYRAINIFFRFIFEKCNVVSGSAHIAVTRSCYESDLVWLEDVKRLIIPSLRRTENVRVILKDAAEDTIKTQVSHRCDHSRDRGYRNNKG